MQITLTDEQAMLQSSALDWLSAHHAWSSGIRAQEQDHWPAFAAMGWLGLPFPEELGGFGCGPVEAGVLMAAMGRHLVTEPYLPCLLVAGQLLLSAGSAPQLERLLPGVMSGELRVALAHGERAMVLPWDAPSLAARRTATGWLLDGTKTVVEGVASASCLLVSAVCEAGLQRLFLVDADSPGVVRHGYRCLHGAQAADIQLQGVVVPGDALLGAGDHCHAEHLQRALALGVLAQGWGACGAIAMLLEQTAAHVQQRQQFGRRLCDFQAVQHRLAEMRVECTEALACCESASMRAMEAGADLCALAAASKSRTARAADYVAKQAIQLHGAMGVCEALPVAAAFRWLEAFQTTYGRAQVHARFLGERTLSDRACQHSSVLEALI